MKINKEKLKRVAVLPLVAIAVGVVIPFAAVVDYILVVIGYYRTLYECIEEAWKS